MNQSPLAESSAPAPESQSPDLSSLRALAEWEIDPRLVPSLDHPDKVPVT